METVFNILAKQHSKPINYEDKKPNQLSQRKDERKRSFSMQSNGIIVSQKHLEVNIEELDIVKMVNAKLAKFNVQNDEDASTEGIWKWTQAAYDDIHEKGIRHRDANTFHKNTTTAFEQTDQEDRCLCGCRKAIGENYSIFSNEQEMFALGPGIILFFRYLRSMIYIMLTWAVTIGLFHIITNVDGFYSSGITQNCSNSYEYSVWYCKLKFRTEISRRSQEKQLVIDLQIAFGVLAIFVLIVWLKFIKWRGILLNDIIDDHLQSSADECVQLEGLPVGKYNEQNIFNKMQLLFEQCKQSQNQKIGIKSIHIIYNLSDCRKLIDELQILLDKLAIKFNKLQKKQRNPKNFTSQDLNDQPFRDLKNRINAKYKQIQVFRRTFIQDPLFRQQRATSVCLVQFMLEDQQRRFLKKNGRFNISKYRKIKEAITHCFKSKKHKYVQQKKRTKQVNARNPQSTGQMGEQIRQSSKDTSTNSQEEDQPFYLKGSYFQVLRAPEPSDINFINCQKQFEYWRVALVWLIAMFLLGLSLAVLFGLRQVNKANPGLKTISIFFIISIQVFNRLIWITLLEVTNIEKPKTKSEKILSVMNKSFISQTINTIILPLIFNLVMKANFQGQDGLASSVMDFQLTVFIFFCYWNFFNPLHRIKKILLWIPYTRKLIIRKYSNILGDSCQFSEIKEVLSIYQQPELPQPGMIVYLITMINHAIFFSYIQPLLPIMALINMCLFLAVCKCMVFKINKLPPMTDVTIFQQVIVMSMRIPFMYGAGVLFFITYLEHGKDQGSVFILSILMIVLGFIGILNPKMVFTRIAKKLYQFCHDTFGLDKNFQSSSINSEHNQPKKINQNSFIQQQLPQVASNSHLEINNKCFEKQGQLKVATQKDIITSMFSKTQSRKPSQQLSFYVNEEIQKPRTKQSKTQQKRKQSYFKPSNLNEMFYFERKFIDQFQGPEELVKVFCEMFSQKKIQAKETSQFDIFNFQDDYQGKQQPQWIKRLKSRILEQKEAQTNRSKSQKQIFQQKENIVKQEEINIKIIQID